MSAVSETVSRHKCLIYEGEPSEQLPVIVALLKEGLAAKRRCLYLGDPMTLRMVEQALAHAGVDVSRETARRALLLVSERAHLETGVFDPKAMVEALRRLTEQAVRDGFNGLCATGDMRWELGGDENFDRLLEYEARLEQAFQHLPLLGVCQYHRSTVPARAIRDALLTHRSVFLGAELNKDNLFYLPPELLIEDPGRAVRDAQGEWMWRQLKRVSDAERERDEALRRLAGR